MSSDAFAEVKLAMMRACGAALDIVPSVGGAITHELFQAMQDRLLELAATGGAYWTNPFANPDNGAPITPWPRRSAATSAASPTRSSWA